MLCLIYGKTIWDKIKNDNIKKNVGVITITKKIMKI